MTRQFYPGTDPHSQPGRHLTAAPGPESPASPWTTGAVDDAAQKAKDEQAIQLGSYRGRRRTTF